VATLSNEEMAVIKLRSRIFQNEVAKKRTLETFRRLQREANEPAVYADSIFSGVDLVKEMERCVDHIRHLEREVHRCKKAIFSHKIRYGETEEF